MTLQRIRSITTETGLVFGELAVMLATCALCKLLGHAELTWQDMSTGRIGVCSRCSSTVDLG